MVQLSWEKGRDIGILGSVFFAPMSASLQSISIGLTLISVLMNPKDRQSLKSLFFSSWGILTLLLFGLTVIGMCWSVASFKESLGVVGKYAKLLSLPFFVLAFQEKRLRTMAIHAFLAAMLITCIISVMKFLGWCHYHGAEDPGWVFRNHIITAYMMAFAAYLTLLCWRKSDRMGARVLYGGLFFLFSAQVLFINMGRTGYLIYFLLLVLAIVLMCPLKKALMLLCSLLVIGGGIYYQSAIMQQRVSETIHNIQSYQNNEDKNTPVGLRLQFHAFSKQLFQERSWLGWGTGGFSQMYLVRQPVAGKATLFEPHSQYWLILVEYGILGLSVLFLYFSTFIFAFYRTGTEARFIGFGMLMSFLLGSLSDSLLLYSSTGYFFLLFMAMGLSYFMMKSIDKA